MVRRNRRSSKKSLRKGVQSKPEYMPTPEEIILICEEIQASWSSDIERYRRTGLSYGSENPNPIPKIKRSYFNKQTTVGHNQ